MFLLYIDAGHAKGLKKIKLAYCKKAATAARAAKTLAKPLMLFPLAPLKTGVDEAEADADQEGIDPEDMVLDAVGIGMAIDDQADIEGIEVIEPELPPLHCEPIPIGPLGSPT